MRRVLLTVLVLSATAVSYLAVMAPISRTTESHGADIETALPDKRPANLDGSGGFDIIHDHGPLSASGEDFQLAIVMIFLAGFPLGLAALVVGKRPVSADLIAGHRFRSASLALGVIQIMSVLMSSTVLVLMFWALLAR